MEITNIDEYFTRIKHNLKPITVGDMINFIGDFIQEQCKEDICMTEEELYNEIMNTRIEIDVEHENGMILCYANAMDFNDGCGGFGVNLCAYDDADGCYSKKWTGFSDDKFKIVKENK